MSNFNPDSPDATFARIIARLDEQDRMAAMRDANANAKLDRIEGQVLKTNGRVSVIETWKTAINARIGVYSTLAGAIGTLAVLVAEHFLAK